jgi:MFS family permease
MVLQIVGGWFSDMVGRLRAIAVGSSIALIGYLMFFLSPSWEWVMLGLCIEYVSNSFVGPSFGAFIAEQTNETSRGKAFGISRGIFMTVAVIGPMLAGFLAFHISFRPMLMVAFGFYLLATVIRVWMATAERFAPRREAQKPTLRGLSTQLKAMFVLLFGGGILTWIWITDAIGDTSSVLSSDLYPIYLTEIGKLTLEQVGVLGAVWGLASILGSFLGGWLTDKRDERTIISAGFLLVTAGMLLMILNTALAALLISRFIHGLGVGVLMPAYDSLISRVVPEERRGLAFGFFGTSLGILSLPMPWIGAQLWVHFSPQTPFWVTAVASAIMIPVAWFKFILPAKETEPNPSTNP